MATKKDNPTKETLQGNPTKELNEEQPATTKVAEPILNKIEYAVTINAGNYESIKLGGEWSVPEGYDTREFIKRVDADMRETALQVLTTREADRKRKAEEQAKAEAEAEQKPKKEFIGKDSPKLTAILKKMAENRVPMDKVLAFFEFDEVAMAEVKRTAALIEKTEELEGKIEKAIEDKQTK